MQTPVPPRARRGRPPGQRKALDNNKTASPLSASQTASTSAKNSKLDFKLLANFPIKVRNKSKVSAWADNAIYHKGSSLATSVQTDHNYSRFYQVCLEILSLLETTYQLVPVQNSSLLQNENNKHISPQHSQSIWAPKSSNNQCNTPLVCTELISTHRPLEQDGKKSVGRQGRKRKHSTIDFTVPQEIDLKSKIFSSTGVPSLGLQTYSNAIIYPLRNRISGNLISNVGEHQRRSTSLDRLPSTELAQTQSTLPKPKKKLKLITNAKRKSTAKMEKMSKNEMSLDPSSHTLNETRCLPHHLIINQKTLVAPDTNTSDKSDQCSSNICSSETKSRELEYGNSSTNHQSSSSPFLSSTLFSILSQPNSSSITHSLGSCSYVPSPDLRSESCLISNDAVPFDYIINQENEMADTTMFRSDLALIETTSRLSNRELFLDSQVDTIIPKPAQISYLDDHKNHYKENSATSVVSTIKRPRLPSSLFYDNYQKNYSITSIPTSNLYSSGHLSQTFHDGQYPFTFPDESLNSAVTKVLPIIPDTLSPASKVITNQEPEFNDRTVTLYENSYGPTFPSITITGLIQSLDQPHDHHDHHNCHNIEMVSYLSEEARYPLFKEGIISPPYWIHDYVDQCDKHEKNNSEKTHSHDAGEAEAAVPSGDDKYYLNLAASAISHIYSDHESMSFSREFPPTIPTEMEQGSLKLSWEITC